MSSGSRSRGSNVIRSPKTVAWFAQPEPELCFRGLECWRAALRCTPSLGGCCLKSGISVGGRTAESPRKRVIALLLRFAPWDLAFGEDRRRHYTSCATL